MVVSPGTKPGLFFPTLALIEAGDEVIYPDPGFPTYAAMIGVAGGRPVPAPLREENDFSFDLEAFDRLVSDRTRLIILNSPANPTGGVIPRADLQHIAAVGLSSRQLADRLLAEGGVAALPGTDFGRYGEGYLRLSYATSMENIERALRRMAVCLRALGDG